MEEGAEAAAADVEEAGEGAEAVTADVAEAVIILTRISMSEVGLIPELADPRLWLMGQLISIHLLSNSH